MKKSAIQDAALAFDTLFFTASNMLARYGNRGSSKRWLEIVDLVNQLTYYGSPELLYFKQSVFDLALQIGQKAKQEMGSLDAEGREAMFLLRGVAARGLRRALEVMRDDIRSDFCATISEAEMLKLWEQS